jgi:hypothetical protein
MAVETIAKPSSTTAFPKAEVEARLREVLLNAALAEASLKGFELPSNPPGQAAAAVRLDSLEVVELLCDIEPIVGFELKDSLVRAGGYNSINQATEHLMPRIEMAWVKHASKGAKK